MICQQIADDPKPLGWFQNFSIKTPANGIWPILNPVASPPSARNLSPAVWPQA